MGTVMVLYGGAVRRNATRDIVTSHVRTTQSACASWDTAALGPSDALAPSGAVSYSFIARTTPSPAAARVTRACRRRVRWPCALALVAPRPQTHPTTITLARSQTAARLAHRGRKLSPGLCAQLCAKGPARTNPRANADARPFAAVTAAWLMAGSSRDRQAWAPTR